MNDRPGQMKQTTGTAISLHKLRLYRYNTKKKKANHWSVHARIKTTSETNLSYFGGLPNEKKKKRHKTE